MKFENAAEKNKVMQISDLDVSRAQLKTDKKHSSRRLISLNIERLII